MAREGRVAVALAVAGAEQAAHVPLEPQASSGLPRACLGQPQPQYLGFAASSQSSHCGNDGRVGRRRAGQARRRHGQASCALPDSVALARTRSSSSATRLPLDAPRAPASRRERRRGGSSAQSLSVTLATSTLAHLAPLPLVAAPQPTSA